jgi:hypothetical protein
MGRKREMRRRGRVEGMGRACAVSKQGLGRRVSQAWLSSVPQRQGRKQGEASSE